jgi:hypothetical protein
MPFAGSTGLPIITSRFGSPLRRHCNYCTTPIPPPPPRVLIRSSANSTTNKKDNHNDRESGGAHPAKCIEQSSKQSIRDERKRCVDEDGDRVREDICAAIQLGGGRRCTAVGWEQISIRPSLALVLMCHFEYWGLPPRSTKGGVTH